jgi:hypothetical protein
MFNPKSFDHMKKNLLTLFMCLFFVSTVVAQNDTLLYENFDVDNTASWLPFNSGNDLTWVNFDADGLPDANNRPQEWFWSDAGFSTIDENDGCLFSSSWLAGFLPGNRNWLMTPPIQIVDASAMLYWSSAPRQTPLYLDGYTVLVSTTDNIEASFTDTIFQAAQYLAGTGNNFAAYTFSPGFVHGMDGTYIEFDADSSRWIGEQRPFSASLASYAGQTIYIAFLHDADDDNLISIDDLLVKGTLVGLSELEQELGFNVYPNPVSDKLELNYKLNNTQPVVAEISDVRGAVVMSSGRSIQIAGQQKLTIDVSKLAAGTYDVSLKLKEGVLHTRFVKN